MVPTRQEPRLPGTCLPRLRGDGPLSERMVHVESESPPPTRGWSPGEADPLEKDAVSLAYAGMVPCPFRLGPSSSCLSRLGGDGPEAIRTQPVTAQSPPPTRGRSGEEPRNLRVNGSPRLEFTCCPLRPRGDEPSTRRMFLCYRSCPLHPRGDKPVPLLLGNSPIGLLRRAHGVSVPSQFRMHARRRVRFRVTRFVHRWRGYIYNGGWRRVGERGGGGRGCSWPPSLPRFRCDARERYP